MKTIKTSQRKSRWALGLLPVLTAGLLSATISPASADPWVAGDLITAISNGQYQSWTTGGALEHTINAGAQGRPDGGFTTGCAFNPAGFPAGPQRLYTTLWSENKISVVNDGTHSIFATIDTTAGTGTTGHPESISFNTAGEFFVGLVDAAVGTPNLLKYSKANALLGTWVLPVGGRGVDSIDLDPSGDVIYYTSEDNVIRTWTITGTSIGGGTGTGGVYHTGAASSRYYGLRLLQGGNPFGGANGTGFLMVADTSVIRVLNAGGSQINSYGAGVTPHPTFGNGWFSISIDSGGSSFVAGDFYSGRLVKFNAAGAVLSNFSTSAQPFFVNGVCVRGELNVGIVPFPTSGFFVVGDQSAGYPYGNPAVLGQNVTFADNGWKGVNNTSGGEPGHNSFKGFAENTVPATADCGGTFESKGGSAGAPAAIPTNSKVAIIVTTQVNSAGGNSSDGVIRAIVLVNVTNYTGGGVPVGTGTVVQVICQI